MSRWYSANVLQSLPGGRRLWRFSAKGSRFVFDEREDADPCRSRPRPPPSARTGSRSSAPSLNVAWLPLGQGLSPRRPVARRRRRRNRLHGRTATGKTFAPARHSHRLEPLSHAPPAGKPDALRNGHRHHSPRAATSRNFWAELRRAGFPGRPHRMPRPGSTSLRPK